MQFSISAAFLALVGSTFAQTANFDAISSPTEGQELVADGTQSYKIVWDPTAEYDGQSVSILLLQGASQDTLDFYPGANVASSIDSALGTYTWTPDSSIAGYATYGLKLQLDSDTTIFQYSFPFKITAGTESSTGSVVGNSVSSGTVSSATVSSQTSISSVSSSSSSAAQSSPSSNKDSASTVTTPVSTSVTASTAGSTGTGSATGSGSGSQVTLTTTTKPSSTGSSTSSTTSAVVTAGAGKVVAGGFAAFGVMAAVLAL